MNGEVQLSIVTNFAACPSGQAGIGTGLSGDDRNRMLTLTVRIPTSFAACPSGVGTGLSGGDRIRTGVQTYSSKAFYMLILF